MAHPTKAWKDLPDHTTPANAAALVDLEERAFTYADDVAAALNTNFRGAWSSATTYALGDGVSVGTNNYISTVSGNLNNNPTTDTGTHWSPLLPSTVVTGSPRVDAKLYGGLPSGGPDGSTALTALFADSKAQTRGIWVPDGTYTLQSNVPISNTVDIEFAPGAKFVTSGGVVGGALFTLNPNHNYNVLTGFSPMNNMHVGDNTVVLTNAGDIAALGTAPGFNVGDWVIFRRGETGAGPPFTPIAEINKILSLTGSGFVLEWPLSKDITISTTTLNGAINNSTTTVVLTSGALLNVAGGAFLVDSEIVGYTGVSAGQPTGVTRGAYGSSAASHLNLAAVQDIFGVKKATAGGASGVIEKVRFGNATIDHDGTIFNGAMVYDLRFDNPKFRCRRPVSHAAIRKQRVYNAEVYLYTDPSSGTSDNSYFWIMGATGFTDGILDGIVGRAQSGGYLHVHEYPSNIKVGKFAFFLPPSVDQTYGVLSIAGGGHDIQVDDGTITNAGRDAIQIQAGNGTAPENVVLGGKIRVFGTIGRSVLNAALIKGLVADDILLRGTQATPGTYPAFIATGTKNSLTRLKIADDAGAVTTGLSLASGSGYVAACDLNLASTPVSVTDPGTYVWGGSRGYEHPSTRRIFIPRGAFAPITGVGTPPTSVAIGAGPYGMGWSFATGVDGLAEATLLPPVDWDQWTVTMLWGRTDLGGGAGAGAQNVRINAFVAAAGNAQSLTTYGAETDTTVAIPAQNAAQTNVIISNHNPGTNGLGVRLVIKRAGAGGPGNGDTFTGAMLLLGAYLTKNNAYS